MLWISTEVSDRHEAESIITQVNIFSMIVTVALIVPLGKLPDRLPAKILIPISFLIVALGLIMFQFLGNPHQSGLMPIYLVVTLITVGTTFATTCNESVFSKNLPKEIRGTMNGV